MEKQKSEFKKIADNGKNMLQLIPHILTYLSSIKSPFTAFTTKFVG